MSERVGTARPIAVQAGGLPPAGRGLLPDYNVAAAAYWWLLAIAGALTLGFCALALASRPGRQTSEILALAAIAAVVGMFALRVPKSKNSIAAGDVFIFLALLLYGPQAAVFAAAAEAAVCAWRTSTRWSSRIASPAAAALAMLACGEGFASALDAMKGAGFAGDGLMFGAAMIFALAYFLVSPTLVTTVIYLKRRRWRNG